MFFKKRSLAVAVAAAAGLAFSAGAHATNGIIQAGNGMAAHGLGGAGLSNANEAMSGFDNPALISDTGDSISMGFSMFMPDRSFTFMGTDYKSDAKMFAIPQIAFTSKVNDQISWGIMVNAMGGMNTDYRSTPFGPVSESVDLSGLIVAPTMSFALNKNISLGASVLLGYENFRVRNLFGSGLNDEGSTMAYGVKLGVNAKVADGISVGAVVQPKMSAGELSFFKNFLAGGFGFTGDAELVLPNEIGVGAKFAIGKNIDIVTDLMYYQWSGVDVFDFFGWEDQYVVKAGVEFRPTDKLALRGGFNYGPSPIKGGTILPATGMDAAFANYPFPAISETHVTVGLGYKMDKAMTVNAYYLHAFEAEETAVTAPMTIRMSQNAFGVGINYQSK
jgi:long-chain fatty acid transport protein